MKKIITAVTICCVLGIYAADATIPDDVREFAKNAIDKDPKMAEEKALATAEKIVLDSPPSQEKGATIYKLGHVGYRITCQVVVSVKKSKMKTDSIRCWNHFGDESNPMP